MAEVIREILSKFNVVRIFMDSQGGGMAIYDLISQPWINTVTKQPMQPVIDMDN